MSISIADVIGKGFGYEERVELDIITESLSGTKFAFVGVANWGPVDVPTQIIKSFKSYFGSEINREIASKDYSGMTASAVLGVVPTCYFTRISDGSDQKATKQISKLASAAKFTGVENVQGASLKINDADKTFKLKINGGTDSVVTLNNSSACAAIESDALPTSLTDPLVVNFSVGDYFEIMVDGVLFQYVVSSSSDLFCKLVGTGKLDDASFGGISGQNVINYVDRIIYALKHNVIGSDDPSRIIRKVGTTKISINSNEVGSSSALRINSCPVVFPTATSNSPLVSTASNTSVDSILTQINAVVVADAQAYVNSTKKFEIQTLVKGAASSLLIYPITALNRNTDFTDNAILGAGTFDTDPSSNYTNLTNGFKANIEHVLQNTLVFTHTAGSVGVAGFATIDFGAVTLVGTDKCCLPAGTYIINLTIDAGSATNHNLVVTGKENWDQFAALIDAIAGVTAIVSGGDIVITSDTTGVTSDVVVAEGSAVTTKLTLTYDAGDDNVDIATLADSTDAHSISQRFTIASGNAYKKFELYFVPSGGSYTSGGIKVMVLKGQEVLASKTVATADITAGYARVTFYTQAAGSDYRIVFADATPGSGATTLTIDNLYLGPERATTNNNLLDFLGVKDNDGAYDYTNITYSGVDANLNMGILRAYYTGSDGNNIFMRKTTSNGVERMTIENDTSVLASFINFSYTVANDTFFGTLINNDSRLAEIVAYELPSPAPTVVDYIPDGIYQLSGGTSGISGITDSQYASALDEYKNLDIFDVDIACVTGNSTAIVIDKINEVCNYRKDCFGFVDPPEVVAGKPGGVATGGIDQMIYWHNGQLPSLLAEKLDSKYLVTFFPWVMVATKSTTNTNQWMAPSRVAAPAFVKKDKENNQFVPAAGKYAKITEIQDIAYYLQEEDKGRAYDDNIGNNINPIVYNSKQGFFIDGQKTLQRERNAYNRISTMRTSLFIKRKLFDIVPNFFYMPIDADTRKEFEDVIEKEIINVLISAKAIKPIPVTDWEIVTDPNRINAENPELAEAQMGMIGIIYWKPVRFLEKLKVVSIMRDTQVIVQF